MLCVFMTQNRVFRVPFSYTARCVPLLIHVLTCQRLPHFEIFEHDLNASFFGTQLYCKRIKQIKNLDAPSNLIQFLTWRNRTMHIKYRHLIRSLHKAQLVCMRVASIQKISQTQFQVMTCKQNLKNMFYRILHLSFKKEI